MLFLHIPECKQVALVHLTNCGMLCELHLLGLLNTLRPRQSGHHFQDDIFKCIFLNQNAGIWIKISLKFDPKGPINKIPALVQIMARRRSGDKPLSEPVMVPILTHICVTRSQWAKQTGVETGKLSSSCHFNHVRYENIFVTDKVVIWLVEKYMLILKYLYLDCLEKIYRLKTARYILKCWKSKLPLSSLCM